MKTVGEFKKAGLVFVGNDMPDGIMKVSSIGAASLNANDCFDGMGVVGEFAWRENTGVKPEFIGAIDAIVGVGDDSEQIECAPIDDFSWNLDHSCPTVKWRPSLNQPSLSVESDTKESAIHKAWVALKGDLKNCYGYCEWQDQVVLATNKDGYERYSVGDYSVASFANGAGNSYWQVICTIKEFTGYCEKMAAEEKRMDIIGQNGNDGLHYDNTTQQVEVIVNNNTPFSIELAEKGGFSYEFKAAVSGDKPIFTQAMADALILPPVGSEFLPIENEKDAQTCLGYTSRGKVVGEGVGGGVVSLFFIDKIKPLDTRTDREKAVDAMLKDSRCNGSVIEICIERLYDAGYRKC